MRAVAAAASAPSSLTSIIALWKTFEILMELSGSINEKLAASVKAVGIPNSLKIAFKGTV